MKTKTKILRIATLLVLLFAICIISPAVFADSVTTLAELQDAINKAPNDVETIITIAEPIEVTSCITVPYDKIIVLEADGDGILTRGSGYAGYMIETWARAGLANTADLTIRNLVVDGAQPDGTTKTKSAIIKNIGRLTLTTGAVLRNNNCTGTNGGAVFSDGAMIMTGNAAITGNTGINGGGIQVYDDSSLIMRDSATVRGNTAEYGGGVQLYNRGEFTMLDFATISDNSATSGGGIYCGLIGEIDLQDYAAVSGNTATSSGGGIAFGRHGTLTMQDFSTVSGNTATLKGGGLIVGGVLTVDDNAAVSGNTSEAGGGIYLYDRYVTVTMNDSAAITDNTATANGGGLYIEFTSTFITTGSNRITGNTAGRDGGGIFVGSHYNRITSSPATVFYGNAAQAAYNPPAKASTTYTQIGFSSTSVTAHPLNNYDINYTSGTRVQFFNLTYDANGGTGGPVTENIVSDTAITVKTNTAVSIGRDGYTFTGWNTQADGGGISYAAGSDITVADNITLYAQWQPLLSVQNTEPETGTETETSANTETGSGTETGTNSEGGTVPSTGDEAMLYPAIGGLLVSLAAAAVFIRKRRVW